MKHLLLFLCIVLFACNSQVDKQTIAQKDSTNIENDEPIKIFHKDTTVKIFSYEENDEPIKIFHKDTTVKIFSYEENENKKTIPEHLKAFKGNWIRTDLVKMVRKNKAMYSNIQQIERGSCLAFVITPEDTFISVTHNNGGMPDTWELTYDAQKQHYKGVYAGTSMFMKFVGTELEIILFGQSTYEIGQSTYEKHLYTKFSSELRKYKPILNITPEIIVGEYDLFDKNNKLIKENVYFNGKEKTNFPTFEEYYIFPPEDVETTKNPRKNFENEPNGQRIKSIEKYIKTSPLIDDDILFLGNRKYGSYFALKLQKDTFLLYPLTKTDNMFGRVGRQIFKKELYYKLVPKVSK